MKAAAELRPGVVIRQGGELLRVVAAEHQLGGGKMPGVVHARLRNLRTGNLTERRFRPEERVEEVPLEKHPMEFLYEDASGCTYMDPSTFEQVTVPKDALGSFVRFLTPNVSLTVEFLDGQPVEVVPPEYVVLRVTSTPEPLRGLHETSVQKEAELESGADVLVPPFVKTGDLVKIEVSTGKYVERVTRG